MCSGPSCFAASCDPRHVLPSTAISRPRATAAWSGLRQASSSPERHLGRPRLRRQQQPTKANRVREFRWEATGTAPANPGDCRPSDGWPSDRRYRTRMLHTAITTISTNRCFRFRVCKRVWRATAKVRTNCFNVHQLCSSCVPDPGMTGKRLSKRSMIAPVTEHRRYQDAPIFDWIALVYVGCLVMRADPGSSAKAGLTAP